MWKTIKNLLSKGGGKCIIIENEKPAYVVMRVEEYESLLEGNSQSSESAEIEKANQDIAAFKAREKEKNILEEMSEKEEIKVEDLPF